MSPPTFLPVPATPPACDLDPASAVSRLLASFLAGRSRHTTDAYRRDLQDFARFCGVATPDVAAALLLYRGPGPANLLALEYRNHLHAAGRAPSTINRRLAAVRSLVRLARVTGLAPWSLEVEGVEGRSYKDTRGPGADGFRRLRERAAGRTDAKGLRDRAIVALLHDMALRRGEVVGLDLADYDPDAGTLAVLGKGRTAKERLTLPPPTREALASWLAVREPGYGPLFRSLDPARKGDGRLTGAAVYGIVRRLGEAVGLRCRPHGLRHRGITAALDAGLDLRAVQRYSRHRDLRTLQLYDDNRQDLGGAVARRVAEAG
jgi:integrase/recombinase XerC